MSILDTHRKTCWLDSEGENLHRVELGIVFPQLILRVPLKTTLSLITSFFKKANY